MKTLYFVRHGLSELNVAGLLAGATDTPLVDEGRSQAKKAGKKAKKLDIDHLIASPLSRTMETAKIIAKEIGYPEDKIEVNPLFVERHFGDMEAQKYKPGINYDVINNAESSADILKRADKAIKYLQTLPYKKIMIVSHGSMGRAMRHHLVEDAPFHHPVAILNAEIIEWQLDD